MVEHSLIKKTLLRFASLLAILVPIVDTNDRSASRLQGPMQLTHGSLPQLGGWKVMNKGYCNRDVE